MEYKIIFGGQVGSGKTTAISQLSDIPVASTEARASDDVAIKKLNTTVAMDYGQIQLKSGEKVHLFGTPGQQRFRFMWDILTVGGLGLVLLVDNSSEHPLEDMMLYIDAFREFIEKNALVIGITRSDLSPHPQLGQYLEKLKTIGICVPVYEIDARQTSDVESLVMTMLSILEVKNQ